MKKTIKWITKFVIAVFITFLFVGMNGYFIQPDKNYSISSSIIEQNNILYDENINIEGYCIYEDIFDNNKMYLEIRTNNTTHKFILTDEGELNKIENELKKKGAHNAPRTIFPFFIYALVIALIFLFPVHIFEKKK